MSRYGLVELERGRCGVLVSPVIYNLMRLSLSLTVLPRPSNLSDQSTILVANSGSDRRQWFLHRNPQAGRGGIPRTKTWDSPEQIQ